MKRSVLIVWFVLVAAVGGTAWWYLFAPGSVPAGQRPLGDEEEFRQAFHAGSGRVRLVAMLSPTAPADLVLAQQFQGLLMEYENQPLEAHVVWQGTPDSRWAPATDAMARVEDKRVRQYWDKAGSLRAELGNGAVLIYSRGAGLTEPALRISQWNDGLSPARALLGHPRPAQTQ